MELRDGNYELFKGLKPVIDRRFIAFDSFEGLPELTDIDLSGEGGALKKVAMIVQRITF